MIPLDSSTYRWWREHLGLTRAKADALLNGLVAEGLARFDVIYGGQTVVRPTDQGKREGGAS
jgi:hypothetical protein